MLYYSDRLMKFLLTRYVEMKHLFAPVVVVALLACLGLAAPQALAQAVNPDAATVGSGYVPKAVTDVDIAMIYSRLTGTTPDFKKWVMSTKEYAKESDLTKPTYLEEQSAALGHVYSLLTLSDPIAVPFSAKLAPYSKENGGYVVQNFGEDTFFSFSAGGDNYALVPQGLADHAWLSVNDMAAKDIEAALGPTREAYMVIFIQPTFADKAHPIDIDGKTYKLISGKVTNVTIYRVKADRTATVLWAENTKEYNEKQTNDLLNLKQ